MKYELININEIQVNKKNPRTLRKEGYRKLYDSVLVFPKMLEVRPIVIDEGNRILAGNMRYLVLKDISQQDFISLHNRLNELITFLEKSEDEKQSILNFWKNFLEDKKIKVLRTKFSEVESKEFIIKDNLNYGEWDFEALANEWEASLLGEWGVEVAYLDLHQEIDINDYDNYEIIDENEIKTDIKRGDLIEIGEHKLLCGDSTNYEDIKKLMNNEKADMIFLDPPFDMPDNYTQHIFKFVNDNCHIFIMNSDKNLIAIIHNNIKYFKRFFAVDFKIARHVSNKHPMTRVDLIAEFSVGKSRFRNLKDGFSTFIECAKIHNKNVKGNYLHEQAKKVELPANFIKHYTDEGDIVCDYFLGAGSTMVAAHILKRKCYGIEIEPKYCQIIIDRMKENFNDIKIKINGKEL